MVLGPLRGQARRPSVLSWSQQAYRHYSLHHPFNTRSPPILTTFCPPRVRRTHPQAFRAALALLQVTPEQLAAWRTDRLQALLLYHVLPAVVGAASVPETDTPIFTAG